MKKLSRGFLKVSLINYTGGILTVSFVILVLSGVLKSPFGVGMATLLLGLVKL